MMVALHVSSMGLLPNIRHLGRTKSAQDAHLNKDSPRGFSTLTLPYGHPVPRLKDRYTIAKRSSESMGAKKSKIW